MLNSQIESILQGYSLNALSKEREKLTRAYRSHDLNRTLKPLSSNEQRLAYLATRLPATYAVLCFVFKELLKRKSEAEMVSLLDVGAGPGTALLAASETFFSLTSATMVERDSGFIALGKQLTESISSVKKNWICQDVTKEFNLSLHDLVIASYSLNELQPQDRLKLVEKLWEFTGQFLVIIEPGTKLAFESLKKLRECLILKGAHLIAPCPHSRSCPLEEKDWCHFSTRVERSSLHRKTKEATLNYEDEKFSYLIFAKNKCEPCHSRVLRRPFKGEGFVKLQLCSKENIDFKTVTKKNKQHYSYVRKIECGDEYIDSI